jgi:hypothetical protein
MPARTDFVSPAHGGACRPRIGGARRGEPRTARGNHPVTLRVHPSAEGNFPPRAGVSPSVTLPRDTSLVSLT